jgi:uncharacterized membrane protein YhdT
MRVFIGGSLALLLTILYVAAWMPFILIDSIYQEITGKPSLFGASPNMEDQGYSPERMSDG